MDISRFQSGFESISNCGIAISTEKYVLLRNSLVILQNDNHFKKTFFWGIIYGLGGDYHIAFGYEKDALLGRIFYYSLDCKTWLLLPQPNPRHFTLTSICTGRFQGDPGFLSTVLDDTPPEENISEVSATPEENEVSATPEGNAVSATPEGNAVSATPEGNAVSATPEGNAVSATPEGNADEMDNQLKEEDRLAATVYMINEEANIVPRGTLFLREDGLNIHSLAFEGIKVEEWDELRNYQHYRVPQGKWNENIMSRASYNYAVDFLDTIASDIPSECWTAQLVDGDRTVILQSLYWPGFVFYHTLEARDHGFIYSGLGKKNLDIPFMQRVITDDVE